MGHIYICITVDWEGEGFNGIHDLLRIREKIGLDVPFTHFICPNYFVGKKNKPLAAKNINKILLPIDEIGLHIHCYNDLINYSDVNFRTEHNYYRANKWLEKITLFTKRVSGRGVPLSVYNDDEIEKIIFASKQLLCEGLDIHSAQIQGFRSGGWIMNDNILDILEKLNFSYDSSAVPPSILSQGFNSNFIGNKLDEYGTKNGVFTDYVINLWGDTLNTEGFLKNIKLLKYRNNIPIEPQTQPYRLNNLIEIPDNCALSDFCSANKTVIPLVKHFQQKLQKNPDESYFIVYGCHQEGLPAYKIDLMLFFKELLKLDTSMIKFICMREVLENI